MRTLVIVSLLGIAQVANAEETKAKPRKQAKAAAVVAKVQPAVAAQPSAAPSDNVSVHSLLFAQTVQQEPTLQLTPVAFRVRKAPAGDSLAQALKVTRDHQVDTRSIPHPVER